MDYFVMRPRHPKNTLYAKRRNNSCRNEKRLVETILRQTLASILILIAVIGVKNVNSPSTNLITAKIQQILFQNLEITTIYRDVDKYFAKLIAGTKNEGKAQNLDLEFNQPSVPAYESLETLDEVNLDIQLLLPIENGTLSSAYGERIDPITNQTKLHEGIDIRAQKGQIIKAAITGIVAATGTSSTYGNYVRLTHDGGLQTLYAHCSQILVKKGQEVMQGSTIAKAGNSGASVGVHLHFELWKDGKALDPLKFMEVPSY